MGRLRPDECKNRRASILESGFSSLPMVFQDEKCEQLISIFGKVWCISNVEDFEYSEILVDAISMLRIMIRLCL